MVSNSGVRLAPTFACKGMYGHMTYKYIAIMSLKEELFPLQLNINISHKCGCNELTLTSLSLDLDETSVSLPLRLFLHRAS